MDVLGRRSATASPRTAVALVLLLALAQVVLVTSGARAHGGGSAAVPVIRTVEPALPDTVEITILPTQASAIVEVTNTSDDVLEVAQVDGTPWLRIGPDGVQVASGVPDTYASTNPTGGSIPTDVLEGTRENTWVTVAEEPTWSWFEHRLHPAGLTLPRALGPGATEAVEVATWTLPLELGDATHVVDGALELQPVTGAITADLTSPVPDGIVLEVLDGTIPGILLALDGATDVVALGVDGAPWFHMTPEGVEVNVNSASHRLEQIARGGEIEESADDADGEVWEPAASVPRHAWVETRARPTLDLSEEVRYGGRVVDLEVWTLPLLVDGEEVAVDGITRWQPFEVEEEGGLPAWWVALPVLGGLGVGVGLWTRRRTPARAG